MQGRYISPDKNAIVKDWGKFVQKNLLPHDQVCEKCNMIITADQPADLKPYASTPKRVYALDMWSLKHDSYAILSREDALRADLYFNIQCPGCYTSMRFTGDEHLPAETKRFLIENYKEIPPKEKKNVGAIAAGTTIGVSIFLILVSLVALWGFVPIVVILMFSPLLLVILDV